MTIDNENVEVKEALRVLNEVGYFVKRCEFDYKDGYEDGYAEALIADQHKSLAEMMFEVVEFEKLKGWQPNDNQFGTSLALLHSEVSEALEAYREGDWGSTREKDGKPEGIDSELVDVFIRLLSTWAQFLDPLGFDIEDSYELKMAYNRTRAHRHGGKAI